MSSNAELATCAVRSRLIDPESISTERGKAMKNTQIHQSQCSSNDRLLELEARREDIVRLWVEREQADTDTCLSVLKRLQYQRRQHGVQRAPGFRFLGASRVCKAGVDCLCMSFCLERDNR